MNHDRPRQKISIEDLLRLKRAERPPAEFWTRFERELRAKQLAAIIEKRPWWHALPRAFAGVTRLHLPLGATAVLAVTVLTVREYRMPSADRDLANTAAVPAATFTAVPDSNTPLASTVVSGVVPATAPVEQPAPSMIAAEDPAASTVSAREITRVINGLGAESRADEVERMANSASRLIIAANLAAVQPAEADAVSLLDNSHGFESRGLPARKTEPLARLASPTSAKLRDRYMGGALPMKASLDTSAASPVRLDRVRASQLRPDDFSRFDAHGDSFTFKL